MDWIETQTKQIISYTVVNLCTSDFQAVEVFCRSFKPETTAAAVLLPNPETTVTFTVSYHQVLLFVIPTAASHYLVIYLTFLSPSLIFFFFSSLTVFTLGFLKFQPPKSSEGPGQSARAVRGV